MNHPLLSILIPAAGASMRLGQPKQLVRLRGSSLLQRAIDAARVLAPVEIIVVTGANAGAIEDAIQDSSVRWIHNSDWSAGMGGSIAMGAASISPESIGLMVILSDQWRITAQDLRTLTDTWISGPQRIVAAEAQGRYMPPVIFPSVCFEQLRELDGHQGARSLFETHQSLLTTLSTYQHGLATMDRLTGEPLAALETHP